MSKPNLQRLLCITTLVILLCAAGWYDQAPAIAIAQQQATSTPTATVTSTSTATATPTTTVTSTPGSDPQPSPDTHEPNDSGDQATVIAVGQRLEKLTFWPLGDVDIFAIDVKSSQVGAQLILDTYQQFGLDTRLRLIHIDGRLVAENDDLAAAEARSHLAIVLPEAGRYLIEISNQAESRPDFKTYALETSWKAATPTATATPTHTATATAAPGTPTATPQPTSTPAPPNWDRFEPNNGWDQAKEIAVGEQHTGLNFVCPDSGCVDNDFFAVGIKGGTCYQFTTADLADGIDTNLIVYGPQRDAQPPIGGNDDAVSGAFHSRLEVCIPEALGATTGYILIGNVGNRVPPEPVARRTYTFQVTTVERATATPAPTSTPLPTGKPTPSDPGPAPQPTPPPAPPPSPTSRPATATPTAAANATGPAPTPGAPPSSSGPGSSGNGERISDAPKGIAAVIVPTTALHVGPGARSEVILTLPKDAQVKLFGEAQGAWVRVQPYTAVVPGWIYAAHLSPLPGTFKTGPVVLEPTPGSVEDGAQPLGPADPASQPPNPPAGQTAQVRPREPLPAQPQPTAKPRSPLSVQVMVVEGGTKKTSTTDATSSSVAATAKGITGLRVQLVNVFGDVLTDAVTPASGAVTLRRDIIADTALFMQIPELGIRSQLSAEAVAAGEVRLTISIPPHLKP